MDIVNDFYHIQDHFAETVLAAARRSIALRVGDSFELGIQFHDYHDRPCSADFLEAVQSVVDVDFALPKVEVEGATCSAEWTAELHRSRHGRGGRGRKREHVGRADG